MAEEIRIVGGTVFSPESGENSRKDIVVSNGTISAVLDERSNDTGGAANSDAVVIDAEGKLITPGLIDFHVHAFRYGHSLSIDVDELSPRSGTTTFVDGGSAGSCNFLAFREYVIRQATS